MSRPVATSGGDARLGGGLALGSPGVEKPGAGAKRPHGETILRGGGKGLGAGHEKPAAPKTSTAAGGALPRGGGHDLGSPGKEKPSSPDSPHGGTHYADPGYQADQKHRLPTHTEAHTRASLRAFGKIKGRYKPSEQTAIGRKLALAAKQHGIDPYENAMRK